MIAPFILNVIAVFAFLSSSGPALARASADSDVQKWCGELKSEIVSLGWKQLDPCADGIDWKIGGTSNEGRPLVYAEFGNQKSPNVTLVFTMVHGDEITPAYIGVQLSRWLKDHESELKDSRVVIAPLVNPDGFYRKPRTRMNSHGVDVNRNFATSDWETGAKRWKTAYRSDPRRFPGSAPRSEPETVFQEKMIQTMKPQKILSIHSPLNHTDYDGPSQLTLRRFPREYVHECLILRRRLKAKSTGFFPGSLGNYAGRELGIPTITLELPTADAHKADAYWKKFSQGIRTMIQFNIARVAWEPVTAPANSAKVSRQ